MNIQVRKKINIILVSCFVALVVSLMYPTANKLLIKIRTHSYVYDYSPPKNIEKKDVSAMLPAQAVPILLYHGVVDKKSKDMTLDPDEANTSRESFIEQMEMLKKEGYETISVREYDLFRQGKFTLPSKPIIITFDDGRKDSFYTVDKVLEKLGFKATIFIATIKANENDPFYLNWEELSAVRDTKRWEIEAHGRRSHDYVIIDENGTIDKHYLISRIYIEGKGFESIEEYKKRVEEDYINGINDLKNNLDINPMYFAVPLNDYGGLEATSEDFEDAYKFNRELTDKYFRLAFVQVADKEGVALGNFYNYQQSDPHLIKRFSVKDTSAENLLKSLQIFAPRPVDFNFSGKTFKKEDVESFLKDVQILYGTLNTDQGLTLISDSDTQIARIVVGDEGWENYSFKAMIDREVGHSVSALMYYSDDDNFISLTWGGNTLSLKERINGKEKELASYHPWFGVGEAEILLQVREGILSAYFSEVVITHGVRTKLSKGAVGFDVWDPKGVAKSNIKSFEIRSLSKK